MTLFDAVTVARKVLAADAHDVSSSERSEAYNRLAELHKVLDNDR